MKFVEVLKIILFGIIEGVTEWLPISSTGHLKLFNAFCPLQFSDNTLFMEMFEYVIQLAAILAVIIIFWKRIFPLGKSSKKNVDEQIETNQEKSKIVWKKDILSLWGKIIIACIPAIFALLIDKAFENIQGTMTETIIIACTLIFYGIVFIIVETKKKESIPKINSTSELSYKTAFFIGCFQVLAAIPGTSRSGITIIGALLLCVSRPTAAEFTFFLAIPTMIGASGYKILKFILAGGSIGQTEILALLIGCVIAFIVSILSIKFLMSFIKKHDFKPFGIYRIILGILVLCALVIPNL